MKKIICVILVLFTLSALASCGKKTNVSYTTQSSSVSGFVLSEQLPSVSISAEDESAFISYLNLDAVQCPHSDLFGIAEALAEKESRNFNISTHSKDFFAGSSVVDVAKLASVVKENNKEFLSEGSNKFFHEELSGSELENCCRIIADAVNWGIQNVEGINMNNLGCVLGNLKIVNKNSPNYASFTQGTNVLAISPGSIKAQANYGDRPDMYRFTITHEAMHLLQCRCADVPKGEDEAYVGTSYVFETHPINPLKHSWLYEASAEINTASMLNTETETYTYMIENLETISLATILNSNVKANQLEKFCFAQNDEGVYKQLEFADKVKAIEFMYAIELLRTLPDDFKEVYEKTYGAITEEYSEFLKKAYNPYFIEVTSKLFYKNLAKTLVNNEISLNDVFYLISLYELDLQNAIPFNNSEVREKYKSSYENYLKLQKSFFEMLQKYTDVQIDTAFSEYAFNYKSGSVYANASLQWLDSEKKDYLLKRNRDLYDEFHKHICAVE